MSMADGEPVILSIAQVDQSAKKPRPLRSRGFAASTEGLHSGTAQAAIPRLAFSQRAFGLGPDISCRSHVARSVEPPSAQTLSPFVGQRQSRDAIFSSSPAIAAPKQFSRLEISDLSTANHRFGLVESYPEPS